MRGRGGEADALSVLDSHPDLRFVPDHAGLPNVRGDGLADWRPAMQALARRPNLACKLSALEFMADWQHWSLDDLRPYQEALLEAFGADRLMLGSN